MIAHQTVGLDLPPGLLTSLPQRRQEPRPILLILEDRLALVTTVHHVVNGPGILTAQSPPHGQPLAIPAQSVNSENLLGVMRFLVDQRDAALRALKDKGVMVSLVEALAVEVPDKPGSLQAVADLLGRSNINLDNCSGFVVQNRAILIIEVHAIAQARAVLEQQGFRLLTQEEMLRL